MDYRVASELRGQIDRIKIYNDPPTREQIVGLFEEAADCLEQLSAEVQDLKTEVFDLESDLRAALVSRATT